MVTISSVKDRNASFRDAGLPQKAFAMNLSRRVHWLSDKYSRTAMIQFALEPVDLLLFGQPFRWQWIGS